MITAAEPLKVAVIGGGAAGLAAARVFSRNGIQPVVLEKERVVGGVWNYRPQSKTRPMYKGLRTNLPREIMAYRERPWGGPGKSYVTHKDVLDYLLEYKNDFDLEKYIQFGAEVTQLTMLPGTKSSVSRETETWPKIQLDWRTQEKKEQGVFDAVCVANGHYARPSMPVLVGNEFFHGTIIHSIEYDEPEHFANQVVLCIGGRASGSDLAREISQFARHVYLSDTTMTSTKVIGNVTWVPKTLMIHADGSLSFDHDCKENPIIDAIIFCTGYDYSFPFINKKSNLNLINVPGERRIAPLFEQLWHSQYPNLSFHGLPHSVIPFPLFELQAEAVTAQLLLTSNLPSRQRRDEEATHDTLQGGSKQQGRIQDTHYLGTAQWTYCRNLADFANLLDEDMENYIATNQVS